MIKLIAIDIDGTLLEYGETSIQPSVLNAIHYAKNKGTTIVLASGRHFESIAQFLKVLQIDSYAITINGSVLYDVKNRYMVYKEYLKEDIVDYLLRECSFLKLPYVLISETKAYTDIRFRDDRVVSVLENEGTVNFYSNHAPPVSSAKINKVSIMSNDLDLLSTIRDNVNQRFPEATHGDLAMQDTLEIYSNQASKASALEYLSKILDIKKTEIAAIGDSENDIKMIQMAGCGIAMANASVKVKTHAGYTTKSVTEAGVAHAIMNIIPAYEKSRPPLSGKKTKKLGSAL